MKRQAPACGSDAPAAGAARSGCALACFQVRDGRSVSPPVQLWLVRQGVHGNAPGLDYTLWGAAPACGRLHRRLAPHGTHIGFSREGLSVLDFGLAGLVVSWILSIGDDADEHGAGHSGPDGAAIWRERQSEGLVRNVPSIPARCRGGWFSRKLWNVCPTPVKLSRRGGKRPIAPLGDGMASPDCKPRSTSTIPSSPWPRFGPACFLYSEWLSRLGCRVLHRSDLGTSARSGLRGAGKKCGTSC